MRANADTGHGVQLRLIASEIERRFAAFHAAHPEVYGEIVKLCHTAKAAGRKKIGIGALWEVMRWNFWLRKDDHEEFRLNNNYRASYARMVMDREPDLAGIFDVRELRS